ncbi:MAG: transcription-repair coupling factor [Alphaproteobacteria bacterium]|nr:transcription-repair coupling factor [Alphaproteobacteria bacterium]
MDYINAINDKEHVTLAGVPDGYDAFVLAELAEGKEVLHVARDDVRLAWFVEAVKFISPEIEILDFPAWDTVPYDRVSPHADIIGRRLNTLSELAKNKKKSARIVVTTISALLQRVPKRNLLAGSTLVLREKEYVDTDYLVRFLNRSGYGRVEQVMEAGEYAMRGGIVDIYPPGTEEPLRLDLFGDEVESIRTFDPLSQRTTGKIKGFTFKPMSEVILDDKSVSRFRSSYREIFGTISKNDTLYESVSEKRRYSGMENWLPCFHDGLDTLFEYMPDAVVTLDNQIDEAKESRFEQILEYFNARTEILKAGKTGMEGTSVYKPLPPNRLYLDDDELKRCLAERTVIQFSPFDAPDTEKTETKFLNAGGSPVKGFADVRARTEENLFQAVSEYISEQNRKVVITAFSKGSRDRLASLLHESSPEITDTWKEVLKLKASKVPIITLGLEKGFTTNKLIVISEQDILGDRLSRSVKKKKKADNFIADISTLSEGDVVVHSEHGLGRYEALITVQVGGAAHDCLRVIYAGGDKLFVPVENIEVLTKYGSENAGLKLDKLGSTAWQSRKARLKKRIRDMTDQLMKVAAERHIRKADVITPAEGLYDEFCARFPYVETDDQAVSIADVVDDLASGRPMDRLICGDVGFGKTEVALRAAFIAAMSGVQVAIIAPTTLLVRQHFKTFKERFAGLPLRVEQLSRLVTPKNAKEVKQGITEGSVDIVIGTHALLAKTISFCSLGLLVIDEEQNFGVAHKERMKSLKSDVHVLTLTATPIPRTLQLALTGVKEMSVITTPPVDRLAIRTFVLPFDPVVVREAILRERFRGGQTFFVCPRVADIDKVVVRLNKLIPDIRIAVAHGQMPPTQLEEIMNDFADAKYDLLVSTNIIESGIDMPSVNTMIIHRSDMFGLAQLYQLRGRIGRSKNRAYAYLTLPEKKRITKTAEKRLHVMQTLDSLGAGFNLASYDMDIRGAGNLLGDEQSGHIKEVGIELYQQLLEEAVKAAKSGAGEEAKEDEWYPQITTGVPVLIPEKYISDLGVRLALYRRISGLSEQNEIEALAAELIDRFGELPEEVENLLEIIAIKGSCRVANVEKVDVGPKGVVVTFHKNLFPNPAGLVEFISKQYGTVKIKPDHKLVYMRLWKEPKRQVAGLRKLIENLALIAAKKD